MINAKFQAAMKEKEEQAIKLRIEIGKWTSKCHKLENKIKEMETESKVFADECEHVKANAAPLQEAVNSLTAERGKFLRKIKRLQNK